VERPAVLSTGIRFTVRHCPTLCHPEQLTCLRQLEREMTPAIATDARPGGPTAKRQPSPEGLGIQSRRRSEHRRCGTVSLGAKPRDLQFCRFVLEMFFERVLMQVEVKGDRAYGARTTLGNRCPSPCRAGLTFRSRPYGLQSPGRFLEMHSQDRPAELQIPRLRSG
jgi:hypothetical protein